MQRLRICTRGGSCKQNNASPQVAGSTFCNCLFAAWATLQQWGWATNPGAGLTAGAENFVAAPRKAIPSYQVAIAKLLYRPLNEYFQSLMKLPMASRKDLRTLIVIFHLGAELHRVKWCGELWDRLVFCYRGKFASRFIILVCEIWFICESWFIWTFRGDS